MVKMPLITLIPIGHPMFRPLIYGFIATLLFTSTFNVNAATLKIATIAPDGTSWMKEMRAGAEVIEAKTEGRVKLKFYPGGVMGNDQAVYRKMRAGQLQGGAVTTTSLAEIYPDAGILSLPMLFRSYAEVDYVRSHFDKDFAKSLVDAGLIPIGFTEGGFSYIMSQGAISSFADLEGKKVWVPENDPINETMIKKAGVTPVPLPFPDVYTGLQTGLIDTVATVPTAALAFQWHTKLNSLLQVPLTYIMGVLIIDAKSFNKIDPEDQAIVKASMGEAFERLNAINRSDNKQAMEVLGKQGLSFHQLPAEGLKDLDRIASQAIEEHNGGRMYSPAVLSSIRELIQSFRNK